MVIHPRWMVIHPRWMVIHPRWMVIHPRWMVIHRWWSAQARLSPALVAGRDRWRRLQEPLDGPDLDDPGLAPAQHQAAPNFSICARLACRIGCRSSLVIIQHTCSGVKTDLLRWSRELVAPHSEQLCPHCAAGGHPMNGIWWRSCRRRPVNLRHASVIRKRVGA
jgi:hypothetical protein